MIENFDLTCYRKRVQIVNLLKGLTDTTTHIWRDYHFTRVCTVVLQFGPHMWILITIGHTPYVRAQNTTPRLLIYFSATNKMIANLGIAKWQ